MVYMRIPQPRCTGISESCQLQFAFKSKDPKKPTGDPPLPFGLNHGTISALRITKFATNKEQGKREK